ncbi:hypothetical protein BTVI_78596 [Pitangus sulphuratus]|nr:hypothetical protein BTVI_78596 [Pitangus sulphuratus]
MSFIVTNREIKPIYELMLKVPPNAKGKGLEVVSTQMNEFEAPEGPQTPECLARVKRDRLTWSSLESFDEVSENFSAENECAITLVIADGFHQHKEKYKEYEKDVAIEEIDGLQLVKKLAKNMEEMFHKKSEAVRLDQVVSIWKLCTKRHMAIRNVSERNCLVIRNLSRTVSAKYPAMVPGAVRAEGNPFLLRHRLVEAAEDAYLKHEFDADLQASDPPPGDLDDPQEICSCKYTVFSHKEFSKFAVEELLFNNSILKYEYFNAVLINERDEEGNYLELGKEFILVPNDHFNNLPVNISLSDVQVPTNMYNKDPAIVNGVYWSESLNKVFVDNFDRDPSLIWQYFGSAKGFFRQYPGIKWEPDENGVIAFDCRNRKWYIQAATSPKDVVILVDVSGSMKGLRLTIAKQTVSSILDTLGDDDFFNIIAYNEELHYVEPCLNGTLVQADRANKEHFREHLDKLFAKGIGMLDIALNEAFNMLNEFNHTGQGSICSQAIMLITDGAVDTYDTIFAKYNWPDRKIMLLLMAVYGFEKKNCLLLLETKVTIKNNTNKPNTEWINLNKISLIGAFGITARLDFEMFIIGYALIEERSMKDGRRFLFSSLCCEFNEVSEVRIFTYLIGREAAFADNLKWMACANKGFFTQISTLADVQENVMEYLHVLSRPKVIDQEHDVVWTEAYIDSTRSKGILLGVVGTDVPVKELLKTIPKYKLGIHGYAFAITNNGYILTHPELRPLYEEGKKRRKPNYSSVDLSEVEWEDRDDVLRNAMVNRKTGKFSMEVKKTVDKGKRVLVMTNDYYYTDIKGTPFRACELIKSSSGKVDNEISLDNAENSKEKEPTSIPFSFSRDGKFVQAHTGKLPVFVMAYVSLKKYSVEVYIERKAFENFKVCFISLHSLGVALSRGHGKYFFRGNVTVEEGDKELIQEVLFDAVVSAPIEAYWTSLALNKSENSDKGVEVAFLGTRTGLSRINLFVGPEQLTNQDFLTAEDKENIFNADHFPLWYRRAAEQIPGSFVYSIPFSTGL